MANMYQQLSKLSKVWCVPLHDTIWRLWNRDGSSVVWVDLVILLPSWCRKVCCLARHCLIHCCILWSHPIETDFQFLDTSHSVTDRSRVLNSLHCESIWIEEHNEHGWFFGSYQNNSQTWFFSVRSNSS